MPVALRRSFSVARLKCGNLRVGERYLSSQGELRVPSERQDNAASRKLTDR
jgi:hypothetical protein